MAQFIASTFLGNGSLWVYIDSKPVMQNSDSVTVELIDSGEFIVHWFATGTPGTSYSITISSPREAQFQLTRTLGGQGRISEGSGLRFKV